jgi:hypothetical protein
MEKEAIGIERINDIARFLNVAVPPTNQFTGRGTIRQNHPDFNSMEDLSARKRISRYEAESR